MHKMTAEHKMTFGLRDDLAAALIELIENDPRSTWDTDIAEGRLIFDLAEQLIALGWVDDYPDDHAAANAETSNPPLAG